MSQIDDKYDGDRILVSIFSQPENGDAKKHLQPYQGGQADVDYVLLDKTFNAHPNKKITVEKSLNRRKEDEIHDYISKIKADEYDKFIFIFLTYKGAEDGLIHLKDNKQYQVEIAFEKMTQVLAMNGKPKLILVQADNPIETIEWFTKGPSSRRNNREKIPSDVDRLVMTSTIPQNVEGSPMIQAFCEVLRKDGLLDPKDRNDMYTLATDINNKVKEYIDKREDKDLLEVPLIFSSLTKALMI